MRTNWLTPTPPNEGEDTDPSMLSGLKWFVLISLVSVLIVSATAYALRGLLFL